MKRTIFHATYKKEIEDYLREIIYKEELRNESGDVVKNLDGKPIWVYKYAIRPKILDVLNRMDMSSYHFYEALKRDKDLENVHTWFKDLIEAYLQEASLDSKSASGAKFQLAAYYGRNDKSENSTQDITIKMDKNLSDLAV